MLKSHPPFRPDWGHHRRFLPKEPHDALPSLRNNDAKGRRPSCLLAAQPCLCSQISALEPPDSLAERLPGPVLSLRPAPFRSQKDQMVRVGARPLCLPAGNDAGRDGEPQSRRHRPGPPAKDRGRKARRCQARERADRQQPRLFPRVAPLTHAVLWESACKFRASEFTDPGSVEEHLAEGSVPKE